ncbi:MAG: lipopolysaccharide assembly protein LapB [Gammaproteobacteria bacterium]|nr:lipopolysaccharide assembly protein LapB [Gammaproteobacteria bacterium]
MALFLFIPAAFITGWWLSRRKYMSSFFKTRRNLYPDYFRGLNYVLDERPDKAIEIFIKMIEVDSETVETHLALGNLFRRKGEVDRAIRLHQNLIARPSLSNEHRAQAYLELGNDYLKLGILDRAEKLFLDLIDMGMFSASAYKYLLDIYQQQSDWDKAINIARRLETITSSDYGKTIALYYCEMASDKLLAGDDKNIKDLIKRALRLDHKCVRASIMEGDMLFNKQKYKGAIAAYKRVEGQEPKFIAEVLPQLEKCYQKLDKEVEFKTYLNKLVDNHHGNYNLLKYLASTIAREDGSDNAIVFLEKHLRDNPSMDGIGQLLKYIIATDSVDASRLNMMNQFVDKILENRSEYQCHICGFEAKHLHWYCPGCKSWGSIWPLTGEL